MKSLNMKRMLALVLATIMSVSMLAGCGSSKTENTSDNSATKATSTKSFETDYGQVDLTTEYAHMTGELTKTVIDDTDVDNEVQSLISEYTDYKAVKRAAVDGDYVNLLLTVNVDGEVAEDYSEDGYEMMIGDQEYGEEVDEKLVGLKAGDTVQVTVTYAEDDEFAAYPGSTVVYDIKVKTVYDVVEPELTETFIKETLGFDSEAAMRESLAADLTSSYAEENLSECKESLIQQIIDDSTFGEYDEEILASILDATKDNYESYASMFGMELADMLEMFYGMTEDDLSTEAENTMHRYAVVMAIAEDQNMEISDDEYTEGLEAYAISAGYDSASELEEEYGEASIRFWLLDDKVLEFIYSNATITEVEAASESETE